MNTEEQSNQDEILRDGGDEPIAFGPDEDIGEIDFGMLDDEESAFQDIEIDPESE
jgi:hypothetical protein